jgi:hypothetical protein
MLHGPLPSRTWVYHRAPSNLSLIVSASTVRCACRQEPCRAGHHVGSVPEHNLLHYFRRVAEQSARSSWTRRTISTTLAHYYVAPQPHRTDDRDVAFGTPRDPSWSLALFTTEASDTRWESQTHWVPVVASRPGPCVSQTPP